MVTVEQLIQQLQALPDEVKTLPVVRADVDWGWVAVKTVEQVDAQVSDSDHGFLEYYPEVSEEKIFKAVKLA